MLPLFTEAALRRSWSERLLRAYGRHFPIRRGKLRIVEALWRRAAGRRGTSRMATLVHGGFIMPCDISEMLQRQFYFFGTYLLEEHILSCWKAHAAGAEVVFDVGANAGVFSLAALAVQPDVLVHAFEPTPEIAARLRHTARINGLDRLHVHEAAVAAENGTAWLRRWRGELDSNEGMNYITVTQHSSAEPVATISVDAFCSERGIERIDLLKLDIQGQEPLALAGAQRMLREHRILMVFAELTWSPGHDGPSPASQVVELLHKAGYEFARPEPTLEWRVAGEWMRDLTDTVARPAAGTYP